MKQTFKPFVLCEIILHLLLNKFLESHRHSTVKWTLHPRSQWLWHFHYSQSITNTNILQCRSQRSRGLRRRSAAARLLRLWVRIPQGVWMSVCCKCCVLPGRERSLRWADHSFRGVLPTVMRRCVWSRNLVNEEALAHWGLSYQRKKKIYSTALFSNLCQCREY